MQKKSAKVKTVLPFPKVLISCRSSKGQDNALVVGYLCNCSFDPPMMMVGVVPSRFSHHIIKETGCFVVNLAGEGQQNEYDYLGSHSGRDGDKLKALNMKVTPGLKVNAPILADCPVNIECKVVDSIVTGSHEMFVGLIEHIHADENLLDQDGNLDLLKAKLL